MPGSLVRGATVLPMDGPPDAPVGRVRVADLRLRDGRIAALGSLPPEDGEHVLDAAGLTALPGFVQGHVHFCQTLFRGHADDLPLLDWLRQRIWPLEAAHDAASVRASAELSVADLLRGGTTTAQVMETVRHTEATFEAGAASGMTLVIGNCLMDLRDAGVPGDLLLPAGEVMRVSERLCDAFHGRGRLRYAVSPRFVLSCSDGLAREAAAFAAARGLRVHTHACEHPGEVAAVRERFGEDTLAVLERQGLLGPRTGLAHCVHSTAGERETLVRTGCAVLHCPGANLKLGSGLAPIAAYRRLGLRVALGADGAPCNNRLSALTELRLAALLQAAAERPGAWPAAQALYAATRGGAEALGLDGELGSLAVGKRADLVLLDLRELEPGGDPVSEIVWRADERHVRHVVLGGEVVVRDGEPVTMDTQRIRAHAVEQRDALLGRAAMAP